MYTKLLSQLFTLVFLFNCLLYADWNGDFDFSTTQLREALPLLNEAYVKKYHAFKKIRKQLINKPYLIKKLKVEKPDYRVLIPRKKQNVIIKKRKNNHIHELYAWELACLLGSKKYVLPSYPMEIGGIRVIVQKIESFEVGDNKGGGYSPGTLKKVSLKHYWKAHLQAYILGMCDLASANIGVNKKGRIRLFDNESCLIYNNVPLKTQTSISVGFMSHSFDWPQYRARLDRATAKKLRQFVDSFEDFENNLDVYLAHRPVSILVEQLRYRLNKVRNFAIKKGVSFRDFYAEVFPKMSSGLEQLNKIVGKILKKKVDHGSSLFFVCIRMKNFHLSPKEKAIIQNWINTYID